MTNTLVIAEAGVNHNGDMHIARELIEAAAGAGADVVKFQTFKADQLATNKAGKSEYQKKTTSLKESQKDMLERLELSPSQHHSLIAHCKKHNIEFLSTAFDIPSIRFLTELNLKRFKIPSGEITNYPYLCEAGISGKKIILSTGMASLGDIEAAINVLKKAGTCKEEITILHCSTQYPTPIECVNLRAMQSISKAFNLPVGYSDHTAGTEVAIAAVAMGAKIIEKHITLNKNLEGPDHLASLEPKQFKLMVDNIRNIEIALGDGVKKPTLCEEENMVLARKSIVAALPIKKGDAFTNKNITSKRPATGISPMRWEEILERTASKDFQPDEVIDY